jgi:dihydroflavonol-4-reductase
MLTVVTGGAGHLGTNLVAALRAQHHDVRIADSREPVTALRLGATWVRGDVRDREYMRGVCEGAEVIYHLAGVISVVGGMRGLVASTNVGGTRVVAQAALAANVRRFIHCSSVHSYDLAAMAGQAVNESSPRAIGPRLPAYDRSKAAGEIEVRRAIDRGLNAVMVNPTGVIGPLDEAPSRVGAVMLALWRRRIPAVVAGGFDWVDVRDVAAGMLAAAERGRIGENYLLPGHRRSISELGRVAQACAGIAVTRRMAPSWLASLGAPVGTLITRATGSPLLPTREGLHALRAFPHVDGAKAARELGHRPRPIEQTVADLYAFFRLSGKLTAGRAPTTDATAAQLSGIHGEPG